MYPFSVFDLPDSATDAQIKARYEVLVSRFPPDRCPREFQLIEAAYGKLRTARERIVTRTAYQGKGLQAFSERLPVWLAMRPRAISPALVASMLKAADDD